MYKSVAMLVALSAGALSLAAEPITVALTPTPVPNPERIISGPTAMAVGNAGAIPIPTGTLKFEALGESHDLVIAGQTVTITWKSENGFTLTTAGKTQPLKTVPNGYGLQTTDIKLDNGKSYLLAFPIAQTGESKGGKRAVIMYRSAGAQVGSIDGVQLWIYDRNADGVYERENDSMRIGPAGKISVFAPIYDTFASPKGIYTIDALEPDGSGIKLSMYTGPTGTLAASAPGTSNDIYMILTAVETKSSAVLVGSSDKPQDLAVPPGSYSVSYALVAAPTTGRINAVILPTSLPPANVQASQTQKYDLGSPFKIAFEAAIQSGKLTIDPATIKVTGKADEVYVQYHWSQRPEISVITGTTPRKLGRMPIGGTAGLSEFTIGWSEAGARKIVLTGAIEGLGTAKGELDLK